MKTIKKIHDYLKAKFIEHYENEFIFIPIGLTILLFITPFTRGLRPDAIAFSGGEVFNSVAYTIAVLFIGVGSSNLGIKLLSPIVFNFKDNKLQDFFKGLDQWVKALIYFGLFFLFLFSFIAIFKTLM